MFMKQSQIDQLNRACIEKMLRECGQRAKITVRIYPHMLKRTFATQTYKRTKNIVAQCDST
jgi:site-specific recombinase XerD